jgi:eIF3 subunit 6 N terminal domain
LSHVNDFSTSHSVGATATTIRELEHKYRYGETKMTMIRVNSSSSSSKEPLQQVAAVARTTVVNTNTITELLEWNLMDQISPYLDRHMIFPLLDYFEKQVQEVTDLEEEEKEEHSTTKVINGENNTKQTKVQLIHEVNEARYALLRPTHMIDYMMDVYNSIHHSHNNTTTTSSSNSGSSSSSNMPEEMIQQKQHVLHELETLKKQCVPLLDVIDTTTQVRSLFSSFFVAGSTCFAKMCVIERVSPFPPLNTPFYEYLYRKPYCHPDSGTVRYYWTRIRTLHLM